jgi:hypothetical protein
MKRTLPPLPKPDANSRFPALAYIQVSIARDILRERTAMRATGTDCRDHSPSTNSSDAGKSRLWGSFAVIASGNDDRRSTRNVNRENVTIPNEKALFAGFANKAFPVEAGGHQKNFSQPGSRSGNLAQLH